MFRRSLLPVVRPRPSDAPGLASDAGLGAAGLSALARRRAPGPPPPVGAPRPSGAPALVFDGGIEGDGIILPGTTRVPATGETYPVKNGYLDLLTGRLAGDNVANLTNLLPGT